VVKHGRRRPDWDYGNKYQCNEKELHSPHGSSPSIETRLELSTEGLTALSLNTVRVALAFRKITSFCEFFCLAKLQQLLSHWQEQAAHSSQATSMPALSPPAGSDLGLSS
jgi:hypothetical protein